MRATIQTLSAQIGTGPLNWPGNCAKVAEGLATLEDGTRMRGHYRGDTRRALIERWRHQPFVAHEWVIFADGSMADPTRWVFEGSAPYIYRAETIDHSEYDEAGQHFKAAMLPLAPGHDGEMALWIELAKEYADVIVYGLLYKDIRPLPDPLADSLCVAAISHEKVRINLTRAQAMWLANVPPFMLGSAARPVYQELIAKSWAFAIPLDMRRMVLR